MSDYTQVTFFAPKDELATGNPSKLIKGDEVDPELSAIASAISSKYDSADLADNATAAALASSSTLITPATLKHAVENGTIQFNLEALTTEGSAAAAGDFVPIHDVSADAPRKVTVTNLFAGQGFVPNSRQIISGQGIAGGGDLSTDRTLTIGQGDGILVQTDGIAVDRVNTTTTATVGYMDMPVSVSSDNYTLVLSDRGKTIQHPSGGGASDVFTIPANSSVAFPIGTVIGFENLDSNALSIAITTDTLTLAGTTTTGTRTLGQNGVAVARKVTSTSWLIWGIALS